MKKVVSLFRFGEKKSRRWSSFESCLKINPTQVEDSCGGTRLATSRLPSLLRGKCGLRQPGHVLQVPEFHVVELADHVCLPTTVKGKLLPVWRVEILIFDVSHRQIV